MDANPSGHDRQLESDARTTWSIDTINRPSPDDSSGSNYRHHHGREGAAQSPLIMGKIFIRAVRAVKLARSA
ncbi:hypothetical protein CERZMDRAFT_89603 [Cercospora zeae-maydis SCOH1-5]|uniref:Uncharacterized protein n=1 Tax=Cercospora zeae-maydis SCOH1-5 TaxID=717836 RepID=A0A6A6FWJ5_9PEZI|nr:hypothetical protein CERZMDRAFT_89603 [Cercospora zeae-maydis SCOH1-5]